MTIYYRRNQFGRISSVNVLERLWLNSFGDTDEECWVCTLKGSQAGHIRIRLDDKKRMMVHRLAYEAYYAESIPKGMQVNHHCDNPSCFNPNHLYLGTQLDNMQDRLKRTGYNVPKKITSEQSNYIQQSNKSCLELSKEFNVTPEAIRYHKNKVSKRGQGKG